MSAKTFCSGAILGLLWCCSSFSSVLAQAPAPGGATATAARALSLAHATDVIHLWQPQQRLYVKGNLGLSAAALDGLGQWLDTHATNWVVVLAENADGETYTDAEGHAYQGVEAVNQAMGKGLMNQTAFSQLVDPRTHEHDAAFFILFLREHKLSYYGSDAQDRRGLGEDHWPGNLDQPAVSAMRNGARVVDAVKDTITQIDRRLDTQIAAEINARKQQAAAELAARTQALEKARASVESARADYSLLEAKAGEFARQHNDQTGDLTRPDLASLRADLKVAEDALARGDTARAQKAAGQVGPRAQAIVRAIDQYPADARKLESLARRIAHEQQRPHAKAAAAQLQAAQAALESARHEYARGDSSYVPLLENASRAVTTAETAVAVAERLAAQRTALWALGLFSFGAGLVLIVLVLNRRRLPAKTEAQQLYALWEKALSEKTDALFGLLDRRATLVGTSNDEAAQRYAGDTLRLCEQIIQDVDELFIMSSSAGRILQQAQALLHPAVIWRQAGNFLLPGRYREVIGLLRDRPIEFRPEEGVELVVRGARTERDRLIGDLASYQPFTMTFNELMDGFNQRAQRALAALDQLERSLQTAPDIMKAVQQQLDQARAAEPDVAKAAAADRLLGLPRLFAELVPAAQASLSEALKRGISDPVGALQSEGARAQQQASDAAALVHVVAEARQKIIPPIRECAAALAKSGPNSQWLEAALRHRSQQADEAIAGALHGSASALIEALRTALAELAQRASRAVALDQARREQAHRQILESTAVIGKARQQIGSGLGLQPGEALREAGKDPTDFVTQAQAQWEGAFAALERGDLEAAQNALEETSRLTTQANDIVKASLEALAKYAETLAGLRSRSQALAARIPEHAGVLAEIQNGYASSVLALGAGDPAHPNANGTIADNLQEAEVVVAQVAQWLAHAAAAYREARLLQSADLLAQAKAGLELGEHRLLEIAEKKQRLVQTDAANRSQLEALERQSAEAARLVAEPTAMLPTVHAFEAAGKMLETARAAVQAARRDPFAAAEQLAAVKAGLDHVADQARCDKDVYAQAGRTLAAAASQVTEAERLASRAATDRLPDSPATQQASAIAGSLAGALGAIRDKYQAAHGDWHAIDQEANGLAQHAAAAAATLRGELERAQSAMAALTASSAIVRNAGAWTGGFGVAILGTPGADVLSRARALLQSGDYDAARRLAGNARQIAEQAIAQAEAEVAQRRRAEEARLEAERRRREAEDAARQRQSFGSSSWGSGSSSSSWGSSGSGVSSSSFSTGSGVSTSSW